MLILLKVARSARNENRRVVENDDGLGRLHDVENRIEYKCAVLKQRVESPCAGLANCRAKYSPISENATSLPSHYVA